MTLPKANIEWTKIGPRDVVQLVQNTYVVTRPDGRRAVVFWESRYARRAQQWLDARVRRDRPVVRAPGWNTTVPGTRHRPNPKVKTGWPATYTTAPKDYDWFGTHTEAIVGTIKGKTIRKVRSDPHHVEAQRDRYASGLHMAADETAWKKLVKYKLVELKENGSQGWTAIWG